MSATVMTAEGTWNGPTGKAEGVRDLRVDDRFVGLDNLGRLYVMDLPGGSARTLAIWITAPNAAVFEQALDATAPVLDSFEFHAP